VGKHLAHGQQLAALAARTLPISFAKVGGASLSSKPKHSRNKGQSLLYKILLTNFARYNTKIIVLLTKGGGA
jgi:hypothetical protein